MDFAIEYIEDGRPARVGTFDSDDEARAWWHQWSEAHPRSLAHGVRLVALDPRKVLLTHSRQRHRTLALGAAS